MDRREPQEARGGQHEYHRGLVAHMARSCPHTARGWSARGRRGGQRRQGRVPQVSHRGETDHFSRRIRSRRPSLVLGPQAHVGHKLRPLRVPGRPGNAGTVTQRAGRRGSSQRDFILRPPCERGDGVVPGELPDGQRRPRRGAAGRFGGQGPPSRGRRPRHARDAQRPRQQPRRLPLRGRPGPDLCGRGPAESGRDIRGARRPPLRARQRQHLAVQRCDGLDRRGLAGDRSWGGRLEPHVPRGLHPSKWGD
mmetsp:Transcript_30937/g.98780  ORF Transcript_30937/g.98780 Transcript_30937/m.98780 type:complete len:251 (+) Transcript_30937:983-1735(+)